MTRLLCLPLLMLCANSAMAQVLVISDSGYALLTQDAAGKSTLTPITQVIVIGKPVPNPNPDPKPQPPSDLTKSVREWYADVPASARGEAVAIAEKLESLAGAAGFNTTRELEVATSAVLNCTIRDREGWQKFGAKLNTAMVAQQTPGKRTVPDLQKALADIARGLREAVTTN